VLPTVSAPASYLEARCWIEPALRKRGAVLIGVDGLDGAGKTSFATWLAWQFAMTVVHLDLYIIKGRRPIEWSAGDLERAIDARLDNGGRPLVVEGILLLQALNRIKRMPSKVFFVELEGNGGSHSLADELSNYMDQYRPQKSAYMLKWTYSNK
jgi:adenylate kinase family enzyme